MTEDEKQTSPSASAATPTVQLKRWIAAPPERVFAAWTDASKISQWLSPAPEIAIVQAAFDARVGGAFEIGYANPDAPEISLEQGTVWVKGKVLEIESASRLVLEWVWTDNPEFPGVFVGKPTRVTVELSPLDGGTQLRLTHEALEPGFVQERHLWGWRGACDRLAELLAR